jgi:hypothetical protein
MPEEHLQTGPAPRRLFAASWRRLLGPALCVLVCVVFYWKFLFTTQYTWLYSPDTANWAVPLLQFEARQWRQLHMPLWDPHQWCGQPLLAQMNGAAYPPVWPFLWFAGRHARISRGDLHAYFVLAHILAALAAYALCRTLGRSRRASLAAACMYSLGAFLVNQDWPPMINFLLWAPLVFLFLVRAVRGTQPLASAALSGAALGISWLSGHHECPIYLSLASAGAWAWFGLPRGRPDWRTLRLAVVAGVFALLASGLQTVTVWEFGSRSLRWGGGGQPVTWRQAIPYTVHTEFSLPPSALWGIPLEGGFRPAHPYLGVCGLALVVLGVVRFWREREARLFAGIGLAGLLLALGSFNVFHGFLYGVLPLFDKARVPARAVFLFGFAAAPLAAYGLDAVLERPEWEWLKRVARAAAIFGGAVLAVTFVEWRLRPEGLHEGIVFGGFAALALAILLAAWRSRQVGPAALSAAIVVLLLMELGIASQGKIPALSQKEYVSPYLGLFENDDIAEFLRRQPQPVRVEIDGREIPSNFGDWHGLDMLTGYAAGVTANIFGTLQYTERTRDLLAVTHYVGREPNRPGQQEIFQDARGLKVFRNPNAFPRAWAVHQVVQTRDGAELSAALGNSAIELREQALLAGAAPALERCAAGDRVRFLAQEADRVVLEAEMGCRGMAVLADTWFPGWQATVDGRSAPILEVYGALRGVVVEQGVHRVEMVYRPWSARLGGLMTLLGIAGSLVLWLTVKH